MTQEYINNEINNNSNIEKLSLNNDEFGYVIYGYGVNYLKQISDGYIICFGFLGDLISALLYQESECTGWIDENLADEIYFENSTFLDMLTHIAVVFKKSKHGEINANIREAFYRTNDNWGLNASLHETETVFSIHIPTKDFLSTKWKFQGMMQILRFMKRGIEYEKADNIKYSNNRYYNGHRRISDTMGYASQYIKLDLIYELSFHKINNDLPYIKDDDPVYDGNGMASYSQEKGILSFIEDLTKYHGILKNT